MAAALAFAGCGGGSSSSSASPSSTGFRRAAEPAESPPPRATPAGRGAAVGTEPEGIAWDAAAGLLAVGVRRPAAVAFVAPRGLRVVRRVPLPEPPRHLSFDSEDGAVLVPAERANELLEVRPGGVMNATEVGVHPHDATAVGGSVFVADEHSDQVSVVRDGKLVKTLGTPHQPGGIVAVAGRRVALVAVGARVLQVYDARAPRRLGGTAAGVGPSHVVARDDLAYVADTEGERVLVFRIGARPRQVASVAAAGAPYGLALDPSRARLWVTLTATNRLAEYALVRGLPRRVATYPTGRQPNSVAVDPRSGDAFVAVRGEGRVERIVPAAGGGR